MSFAPPEPVAASTLHQLHAAHPVSSPTGAADCEQPSRISQPDSIGHSSRHNIPAVTLSTGAPPDIRGAPSCLGHRHTPQSASRQGSPGLPVYMGSPKSGARGALHARCSKLWGIFHVPSGMHTVLLLTILAWLCYLGAWLLLDFSLGNHLQVSLVPILSRLCAVA